MPMASENFKAVLFDCDGVLVDSESIIIGVWHQLALAAGAEVEFDTLFKQMTGQTMDTCIDCISTALGKPVDQAMKDQAWKQIGQAFKSDLVAFDGVSEVLAALKKAQKSFAVASNSETDPLYFKLRKTELRQYFKNENASLNTSEFVFSSEMVAQGKPAPDVYLLAAEKLGIAAKDCLVIEDSVLGAQAGIAAGMSVWGLVYAETDTQTEQKLLNAGCERVIHSISEVLTALSVNP